MKNKKELKQTMQCKCKATSIVYKPCPTDSVRAEHQTIQEDGYKTFQFAI